jgi:hypothetical protein
MAAQIEDQTKYVITHGTKPCSSACKNHFSAMRFQVKKLKAIFSSDTPWENMVHRYPDLRNIVSCLANQADDREVVQNKLLELYRCHVEEWLSFQPTVRWDQNLSRKVEQFRQLPIAW